MSEPAGNAAIAAMVAAFQPLLPPAVAGLPQPSLSVARAALRPSGIGNIIGTAPHGAIAAAEQHALHVTAVLRFMLWGFVASEADAAVTALTEQVFAQRTALTKQGFLRLDFDGSSPPEETRQPVAWRRFADYEVLYEFPYEDTGAAAGLILPIQAQETTTGTVWNIVGDFGRWDDAAAPIFSLRGPAVFTALAALSFFAPPGTPPDGSVTIARTFDGAPPPPAAADLADFLAQTTVPNNPVHNLAVSFASLTDLLARFAPDGTPLALGDRDNDGVPDLYQPARLAFPAPLILGGVADRLELSFSQAKFDRIGVLYLRAVRQGS